MHFPQSLIIIFAGSSVSHLRVTQNIMSITRSPLTTTFTPLTECFTSFYDSVTSRLGPRANASECFPSGYDFDEPGYFSPGLYCPQGYTTATTSLYENDTITETIVNCCPEFVPSPGSGNSFRKFIIIY